MKAINVCQAETFLDRLPQPAVINIKRRLPKFDSLKSAADLFNTQADMIAGALYRSLPAGTRIRLLHKLMEYEISANGYFRGI
jgi:hypothetical protein